MSQEILPKTDDMLRSPDIITSATFFNPDNVIPDGDNAEPTGDPDAPSQVVPNTTTIPGAPRKPTGASIIDPVNRIEGHLRIDMEVQDGFVSDVWVTGGLFRGMELVLQNRAVADAAYITQRICGVCPVSHAHTASIAGEKAYNITIPNGARIIRNILEGAQFLHSSILWFYNLAALDYVNPLNALSADITEAVNLANAAGTTEADFAGLQKRLKEFADNGQLSIFSGNWFDTIEHDGSSAYKLPPELDLVATQHYLEALEMQAVASEISGIIGGKMPHVMTSIPGGTAFMPTEEKLDELLFRVNRLRDWVARTMVPDALAIVPHYMNEFEYGGNAGNYLAWGVFDRSSFKPEERYLPGGIWSYSEPGYMQVKDQNEDLITETTISSFYDPSIDDGTPINPRQGITAPLYKDEYIVPDGMHPAKGSRYTWDKAPRYDDLVFEAGGLSRMLVAYNRGIPEITAGVDGLLSALGVPGRIDLLNSTMGRTGSRIVETAYLADLMVEWVGDLISAIKEGDAATFVEAEQHSGSGSGMWEAPRGALYHHMEVKNDIIEEYQIIIPSTWNISPRDEKGRRGPMEEALMGLPVEDVMKPIHALRAVHSFDPCVACAVHVSEPATGKKFTVVTSPWGVK